MARLAQQLHQFWVLIMPFDEQIFLRRAKALAKGNMLLWREVLIPKENRFVLPQSLADFCHLIVAHGLAQIDASDFSANAPGDGLDCQCGHEISLLCPLTGRLKEFVMTSLSNPP
jgi:hypothetical protein